jgi:poly-gamma-glutamate capsule biosynthesis protein CapA/YwtB (metallophosphatase superfamily)
MNRRHFLAGAGATAAFSILGARGVRGAAAAPITVAATGDCILSRRVSQLTDPGFLRLVQLLRSADCAYGNCELVMASSEPGYPTAAGASLSVIVDPKMAEELAWLGYDVMGTANNHSTDYGVEGIRSTIANLERVGIGHAGTGLNLQQAAAAGYADTPGGRVALINCASSFAPWSPAVHARGDFKGVPGLNPVRVERRYQLDPAAFAGVQTAAKSLGQTLPPDAQREFTWLGNTFVPGATPDFLSEAAAVDVKRLAEAIQTGRRNARLVLVSIHAHESYRTLDAPARFLQPLARACIDAGADAFFGAGPHVTWGIELYKGKPICYSLGDFLFQYETVRGYAADTYEAFKLDPQTPDHSLASDRIALPHDPAIWESVLPMMTFAGSDLQQMVLHPVASDMSLPRFERGTPSLATGETAERIISRMIAQSKSYGTSISFEQGRGIVRV